MSRPRDERGSITPLIIGFATILVMAIALVVDASAAYLQRSGLSTLADGAALYGADAAATGASTYAGGVPTDRLGVDTAAARAGVESYLRQVGAHAEYPGLQATVRVDPATSSVLVELTAPLDLPLPIPGAPDRPLVTASGEGVSGVAD